MPPEISVLNVPPAVTAACETRTSARALLNRLVRPGLFRSLQRLAELSLELSRANLIDSVRPFVASPTNFLRVESGLASLAGAQSLAIYVHWSPNGAISAMVAHQLALYRQAGFAVIFVTVSPDIHEPDWQILKQNSAMLIHRRNLGRDFGAWKDALALALQHVPEPEELLLVNDSVLGPLKPLDETWGLLRASGEGLFGLTESIGGGPHLQSYFLLGRGRAVVRDLAEFFRKFKNSSSKWLVVQRGEIGLTKYMRARSHRVSALFGYDRLVAALASDPESKKALAKLDRRLARLAGPVTDAELLELLHDWPVNPTQHLWRQLVTRFGFPFLKTDLLRRNVHNLPGTASWPELVDEDSPCGLAELRAHLAHESVSSASMKESSSFSEEKEPKRLF